MANQNPDTLVVNTSRSFPHALLITGFVNRLTQRMSLVEHQSSPLVLSGVRENALVFTKVFDVAI
jgi:hypothetical protein